MNNLLIGIVMIGGLMCVSSSFAAEKVRIQLTNNTRQPIDFTVDRNCVAGEDYIRTIYPMSNAVFEGEAKLDGSCATETKVLKVTLTGGAARGTIETKATADKAFSEPENRIESGNYTVQDVGPGKATLVFR